MKTTPFAANLSLFVGLGFFLVACPSPKMPEGPPPEYEEPARPSWYDGGAPEAATDREAPPSPDVDAPDAGSADAAAQ